MNLIAFTRCHFFPRFIFVHDYSRSFVSHNRRLSIQNPLISATWLAKAQTEKIPGLVILDASLPGPGQKEDHNVHESFLKCRIPSARFFDLEECRMKESQNSNMLPNADNFARYVCGLGISNNSKVIVYDSYETGMFSSPRVWWMFRVFGHRDVSILDGGLTSWTRSGYPVSQGESERWMSGQYVASLNRSLVLDREQVERNIQLQKWQLVDARSEARFRGLSQEPHSGIKPGHIPKSINMFWKHFLDEDKKVFKTPDQLKALYKQAGLDPRQPHAASCGSGITACFIALGSYILGNEQVPVYDGSWMDWYQFAPDHLKIGVPRQ